MCVLTWDIFWYINKWTAYLLLSLLLRSWESVVLIHLHKFIQECRLSLETLQTFNKIQMASLLICLLSNMLHLHYISDVLLEVPSGKTLAYFYMYKVTATDHFFSLSLSTQQQIRLKHAWYGKFNSPLVALCLWSLACYRRSYFQVLSV